MKTALALLLGLTVLTGCGFSPAYAPAAFSEGAIQIPEISGRTGHMLRRELLRSVSPGLPGIQGTARLEVDLTENIQRLAFAPDEAASRSDYVATARWSLISSTGDTLVRGVASEAASFNFADAAFADISAQSAAQERVAILVARSIRQDLLLKLDDPQPAAATGQQQ